MLELLNSNYAPVKTSGKDFESIFYKYLENSKKLIIASGYVSEDSIADLLGLYKTGLAIELDLIIGMHYFEGFSYGQYASLCDLSEILQEHNLGNIYLASSVKYHGKVYLFENSFGQKTSIIGSSNLTKISPIEHVYDTDIITDEKDFTENVSAFLDLLKDKNCKLINEIDSKSIKILPPENMFENYLSVSKVSSERVAEIRGKLEKTCFEIPLKTEGKSNLNCYFGKGRKNFSNGSVLPRSWYEVELIVGKEITSRTDYPKTNSIFTVITDDGYKFNCKTSGDYSKNFRSADDLKILGRWIKGRMENVRALNIGEKVTDDVLKKYGRNTVTFVKTSEPGIWFLDFGV